MIKKQGFLYTITIVSLSLTLYFLLTNSLTKEKSDEQYHSEQLKNYTVYAPYIPKKMFFAGEEIPLQKFDVYESLDNEMLANGFWHSQMIRFLKRAHRYFPIIEPILKKNNIPDDFKYLAVAESALSNAVSPSGAKGFWQFLFKTGKEYDLVINKEVDERYNLEKTTQAACDYFNDSYKKYGNWTLVAASYNMGMGGLFRQIKKQKVNSYYDLLLNKETSRYVFRIIAIKTLMENPHDYGFRLREDDLYSSIPVKIVKVDTTINNLVSFAFQQKTNYKILKILNPWLRKPYLKNIEKRSYQIKIPEEGFRTFVNSQKDTIKDLF